MPDPVGVSTHYRPLQAAIDTSSSGAVTVVSAVANRSIVVVNWNVMSNGTTSIRWLSGSNNISGLYPLIAQLGCVVCSSIPEFGLRCNKGEDLVINNSAAVQIGGYVNYYLEPA